MQRYQISVQYCSWTGISDDEAEGVGDEELILFIQFKLMITLHLEEFSF